MYARKMEEIAAIIAIKEQLEDAVKKQVGKMENGRGGGVCQ